MTREAGAIAVDRIRQALRRRKTVGLLTFAVVAAVLLGTVAGMPPVYRAAATILVEPPSGSGSSGTNDAEGRIQRMTEEIQSREALGELVTRFDLYAEERDRRPLDAILQDMRKEIEVQVKGSETPGRPVTAFVVSYRGRNPEKVAQVTNALSEMYLERDSLIRTGNVGVLGSQLAELRRKVESQERELADFHRRFPGELPQEQEANLAALQRLDMQARMASDSRMRALERRSSLLRQIAEHGAASAQDASGIEARLGSLRKELDDLQRKYTDKYPDVARLRTEIAALESEARTASAVPRHADARDQALRDSLAETEAEIVSLREEEQRLRQDAASYRRRIDAAPRRLQSYQKVVRDYETTRVLYEDLLKRHEAAQLADSRSGEEAGRLRLVEPAAIPKEPVAPRRARLFLFGLVVALGAAVGAILLAEHADASFHSAEEVRTFTRVPVLSTVPRMAASRGVASRMGRRALVAVATAVALFFIGQASYRQAGGNHGLASILSRAR